MTDYQCTCEKGIAMDSGEIVFISSDNCILHDPKLKGSLMVCQRLDKLIEVLTQKSDE